MSRSLTPQSNLESLRAEAKRWFKAIVAGNREAQERFNKTYPDYKGIPKLRQVQHALARELGLSSWADIKYEIENRARSHADRVQLFLEKSVNRYSTSPLTRKWGEYERDGQWRGELAARILARNPEVARASIHTAVVAHDLNLVREFLAKNPMLANERSAYDGWPPLVRLAYVRLPVAGVVDHALAIATQLLDSGADPNAGWSDGTNAFTVLVGVIGDGEASQAPHPLAESFARLLISRGADPFSPQALYNTSLGPDSTFWLDLLWSESAMRGETHKWTGPAPTELGGEKIASALSYLLGNAVPKHIERIRWLLDHGADARGVNAYTGKPVVNHAALAGREDVVGLLIKRGAGRPELTALEQFLAACESGDVALVRDLVKRHPQFLLEHDAMFAAIRGNCVDVAAALVDLGMSVDVGDGENFRALHFTTHCGALEIARMLIARGAEIDPFERRHGGSPLTHACYQARQDMIDLLAPVSRNFRGLCYAGATGRLRQLLNEEPARANRQDRPGETALFCMPSDEDQALEVAELLLSFGADPNFRNPLGQTPAQAARAHGLEGVAAILEQSEK